MHVTLTRQSMFIITFVTMPGPKADKFKEKIPWPKLCWLKYIFKFKQLQNVSQINLDPAITPIYLLVFTCFKYFAFQTILLWSACLLHYAFHHLVHPNLLNGNGVVFIKLQFGFLPISADSFPSLKQLKLFICFIFSPSRVPHTWRV